ncbi:hypothetical protein HOF67_02255 [Candidatus Peregrinibacteria bacterium]|jgi:L-ascorbate metabolism protein UlaG (beta-lactamase superfamily)|nr:hypothetical protein [Candidatus Peregrinibacteria bacterium]
MDILWHGNSCFTCKGKNGSLVINPDKSIKANLKADAILSSIGDDLAEVKDIKKTFDWPGEYEISGIPIAAISAWTRSRSKEEEEGQDGDRTTVFYFEIDNVKICHLGNIGHKLTTEMADEIGDVDVLLIPIGEDAALKGKTEDLFDQIDPRVVIPYGTKFTDEELKKALNAQFEPAEDKFTAATSSDLPDDKTRYVSLKKA